MGKQETIKEFLHEIKDIFSPISEKEPRIRAIVEHLDETLKGPSPDDDIATISYDLEDILAALEFLDATLEKYDKHSC